MAKFRIFNGKRYYLSARFWKKSAAQKRIREIRKAGDSARLVPDGGEWAVYRRLG